MCVFLDVYGIYVFNVSVHDDTFVFLLSFLFLREEEEEEGKANTVVLGHVGMASLSGGHGVDDVAVGRGVGRVV